MYAAQKLSNSLAKAYYQTIQVSELAILFDCDAFTNILILGSCLLIIASNVARVSDVAAR
jgi:hypothetical protein